jgi:hypothetical protein
VIRLIDLNFLLVLALARRHGIRLSTFETVILGAKLTP